MSRLTIEGEDEDMEDGKIKWVGVLVATFIAFFSSLATLSTTGAKPLPMICGSIVAGLTALGAALADLRT